MIKHVNDRDHSRSRPKAGASTHDSVDYEKPALWKKSKGLVIHTSTNNIQQEINTMNMVKKLVKDWLKIGQKLKMNSEKETEIIFSGLIQRKDDDFLDQIEEING